MHPAVDEGILQLAQMGRLSATSCLAHGPAFAGSAAALRASSLQAGLHLNFTERLEEEGVYMPVSALIARCWTHRLDPVRLRAQIERQLDAFISSMGRSPDFVDGHQHVHQFPQISEALLSTLELRAMQPRPWLRCTRRGSLAGMPASLRFKSFVIELLGARRFGRLASAQGYRSNSRFLGVYDFSGGEAGYAVLLRQWLEHARDGDVIMCHPSRRPVQGDVLGQQRQAEFDVLRSSRMQEWMDQYGVFLV